MTYEDHIPPADTPILPVISCWPGPQRRSQQDNLDGVGHCVALAQSLRSCYGPRGLAKSLLFRFPQGLSNLPVSSPDTASVLAHMNLNNPQAFTIASAATNQAMEHGDGAGLVLLLASSLLTQATHLLALGVTGAEIQAGYRLGCGRALVLLEQQVCGRLQEPKEELQVRAILRPFLASWQPGFDSLLEAVVARCCVYSWKPITSGEKEVWEGVTFEPTCVRVCIKLEGATKATASDTEDNKKAEEERGGKGEQETEVTGEQCKEEEREQEKTSEKQGQMTENEEAEQQGDKTKREELTEPSEEEEERGMNRENNESLEGEEKENQDKQSANQEEEVAKTEGENKENGDGKTREEDEVDEETHECDEWVDLGLEIWETVSGGGAKDDGVVWTQEINERPKLIEATRIEAECRDPLSVNIYGSINKLTNRFFSAHLMYKHITSVHFAQYRHRLHRSKGQLTKRAHKQYSPSKTHRSPREKHQPPRCTNPANNLLSLPLQASVMVEEPLDEDSCCSRVSITLCSPDQALLDSAQVAVAASLRVYHSLLVEPRLVPGAGAAEVALAVGLTHDGLGLVGMEQLVMHAFSQALLEPAKALGENSGTPADLAVLQQYGRHWGVKREGSHKQDQTQTMKLPWRHDQDQGVMDGLGCKASAIQKATEATLTILSELHSQTGEE